MTSDPKAALKVGIFSTIKPNMSQRIGARPSKKFRKFINYLSLSFTLIELYQIYKWMGQKKDGNPSYISIILYTAFIKLF
jgi:hypothetical protein